MKKKRKFKICIVIIIVVLLVLLNPVAMDYVIYHSHNHRNIADWENGTYLKDPNYAERAKDMIPYPVDVDGYEKASFYWNDNFYYFGFQDYSEYSVCLELEFDQSTYSTAKEQAISTYEILKEPITKGDPVPEKGSNGEQYYYTYTMPITQTKIGNYTVMIVRKRIYPDGSVSNHKILGDNTSIGFLAFHDKARKIRYCYLCNYFIDAKDTEDFYIHYFKINFPIGWK